ncbi:MAG: peptidoglycan bridge formation glycyltransferase FemA/FemB family protein [Candidatus Eisenbacteria bacterium]|nr:peptidoglycan bridge formation glycyltransferase FemA/FemB family protein [Candidatus Eisenbacteria bacterium]
MSTVRETSEPSALHRKKAMANGRHPQASGAASSLELVSLELQELTPELTNGMSAFLSRCPLSTAFHSVEWNLVLSSEFNLRPVTSLAIASGQIVACNTFYTRRGRVGLRTSWSPPRMYEAVYGGPIFLPHSEEAALAVLKEQERVSGGHTNYVITPPGYDSDVLRTAGYSIHDAQTVILALKRSEEDLWQMLGPKRRNMIRRAQKEGVEVRQGLSQDVPGYHELLQRTLGRWGKTPAKLSFFLRLIEELVPVGIASFHVGVWGGKIVAGEIMLHTGSTSLYFSGASSEDGRKHAANDLLQWNCILGAKGRGSATYDFLGIDAERLPGISMFKMGFGGTVVSYCSALKRTYLGQLVRVLSALRNPERALKRLLASR